MKKQWKKIFACKSKKIKGLRNLKGLRGFWYYDVPCNPKNVCVAESLEFKPMQGGNADYDGGIFSSTAKDIENAFVKKKAEFSVGKIELSGKIQSYTVTETKFNIIKKMRKRKEEGLTEQENSELHNNIVDFEKIHEADGVSIQAYRSYQGKPKLKDPAIAIGMVLALIAAKGSVENGNKQPYIMLVHRQNKSLRNNELDAAVVEGLNAGDFVKNDANKARLDQVARRALEEERGLNCTLLEDLGLLHMPERYYFGYEDEYLQWNFFGTVVVDCTIEELIREGFYFTKDKFESKGILGIPLDPQVLYYHLSQKKIGNEKSTVDVQMWKHGWASVLFAVRDYFGTRKTSYAEQVCLYLNHGRRRHAVWRGFRSSINCLASGVTPRNHGINMLCAALSALLLAMTVLYFKEAERFGNPLTLLSTVITVITCWCVVALARDSVVSSRDIFYIDTNHGNATPIFETRVFRNIALVDGSLVKDPKISFGIKEFDSRRKINDPILVSRKDTAENLCWKIIDKHYDDQEKLRFIFPLIVDEQNIVLCEGSDGLSHCFDFYISYKELVEDAKENGGLEGQDQKIKDKILENLKKEHQDDFSKKLTLEDMHFYFLLKGKSSQGKQELIIVGFINCQQGNLGATYKCRPLSYDLTNTDFALRFRDDATRVTCEYAVAKYVGYKMETR